MKRILILFLLIALIQAPVYSKHNDKHGAGYNHAKGQAKNLEHKSHGKNAEHGKPGDDDSEDGDKHNQDDHDDDDDDDEEENDDDSDKVKTKREFPSSHPVFGTGKLHPVHDDKVIGKFKNKQKIKEEVKTADELLVKREELLKSKSQIEKTSAQIPIVGDWIKNYNMGMKDLQIKQIGEKLNKLGEGIATDGQEPEAKNLIQSYIKSKLLAN